MSTDTSVIIEELRPVAVPPPSFSDKRQADRLPGGFVASEMTKGPFDPRLAWDLAMQMDPAGDVFRRYGVDEAGAADLLRMPLFVDTLRRFRREIEKNGTSFRAKARVMAEDLLAHSYLMATDAEAPPAVRADLIKWTAKMGDLEPATKKEEGSQGGGFQFQIVFSGQTPPQLVGSSTTLIEGEKV